MAGVSTRSLPSRRLLARRGRLRRRRRATPGGLALPRLRHVRREPRRQLVPAEHEDRSVRTGLLALAAAGALRLLRPHDAEVRRLRVHLLLEVQAVERAVLGALVAAGAGEHVHEGDGALLLLQQDREVAVIVEDRLGGADDAARA